MFLKNLALVYFLNYCLNENITKKAPIWGIITKRMLNLPNNLSKLTPWRQTQRHTRQTNRQIQSQTDRQIERQKVEFEILSKNIVTLRVITTRYAAESKHQHKKDNCV